ncbi:MAG: MBL fold metallo-hydrolase [Solirubrobacterales bacterium]|nr:MBL fold metallo-hydrolase [Solirubrobacterales bacterium]MCB8971368.1 MBL fold metallo-hydrolase [Thermoleophilales bacterium]MCO5328033.1 MBL fold metallo-hydrolase [Solirubrobacterales bacterium]
MSASAAVGGTRQGQPTTLGEPASFDGGLTEIGEGAWAWLQPNGGLGESNAGLICGEGEALLVDTLWDERLTRRMLDAMEPVLASNRAPLTHLFNTHGDGDHWYGNGLPGAGVEIVATERAAAQMADEPPAMLTRLAPVGSAAGAIGKVPLLPGAASLRGLGMFMGMLSHYEFDGIQPRLPSRTFTGEDSIEVGGRTVELIEVGPAHTVGDAIAWVPDARVVYAGDILFNGIVPIMWAGPVDNWLAALDRIEGLEPATVVGGHGPPGGAAELATLREYWTWLAGEVADGGDEDVGKLTERLIRSADWRGSEWADWAGAERTLVNVARIRSTSADGGSEIGTIERMKLIGGMGALAERLRD